MTPSTASWRKTAMRRTRKRCARALTLNDSRDSHNGQIINQVLDEIGINLAADLADAPVKTAPATQTTAQPVAQPMGGGGGGGISNSNNDDLTARLNNLRKNNNNTDAP